VARCLVSEYLLKYFPYEDLIIYETGAGNGTLALNVLDFLASEHPEVYERTQYNIVEISANLAKLQKKRLSQRHPCIKIYNQSIFDWKTTEHAPCFVVALEVVVSVIKPNDKR
jgi:SAM-dependent MidA family methyltransferase